VSIRRVDEAKMPYNMLVDKFKDLRMIFCCPFRAVLSNEDLNDFIYQEYEDAKSGNTLYSVL